MMCVCIRHDVCYAGSGTRNNISCLQLVKTSHVIPRVLVILKETWPIH